MAGDKKGILMVDSIHSVFSITRTFLLSQISNFGKACTAQ